MLPLTQSHLSKWTFFRYDFFQRYTHCFSWMGHITLLFYTLLLFYRLFLSNVNYAAIQSTKYMMDISVRMWYESIALSFFLLLSPGKKMFLLTDDSCTNWKWNEHLDVVITHFWRAIWKRKENSYTHTHTYVYT